MTGRGALWVWMLAAASVWAAPDGITLQVRTNRTVLMPGDRLEYIVRVEHPASIEFVRDHLKKEEMNLAPFDLLDINSTTGNLAGNRKFLEVRLLLTTYDVAHTEATVPAFNLFFFRQAKSQTKDDTPAETYSIPPLTVGLRSTLADPGGKLRDYKEPLPIRTAAWAVPEILGVCGLLAIALFVAWLTVAQIKSGIWKQRMAERSRRKSLSESLDEIRQTPADSRAELESFYQKAAQVLRALAAERLGDGAGLTPGEMRMALEGAGAAEREAATLSELLEQCDTIRYAPNGLDQGRQLHTEFVRKLEELTQRH